MTAADELRLLAECGAAQRRERMALAALQAALDCLAADCRTPLAPGDAALLDIGDARYIVPREIAAEIVRLREGITAPTAIAEPPPTHVCSKVLGELNQFRSWKLELLSPTTYPPDIARKCPAAKAIEPKLKAMLRGGHAYRCRIAKGPYCYASNIPEAVDAAIGLAVDAAIALAREAAQ